MTPPSRLATALHTLHWSAASLAAAGGYHERTVRRWLTGQYPPLPGVVEWLETLAAFHRANPAPKRED